jgi:hypothetical protein
MKMTAGKSNITASRGQAAARVNTAVSFWFFAARYFAGCFYFYFINPRRSCITG